MKLICGLGNPGKKYENTRHNVGFDVLKEIASKLMLERPKAKFDGEVLEGIYESEKLILICPLTYMNDSGKSVAQAARFFDLDETSELLIVCDDFNLDCGKLRFRAKGSSGGQKGLESIINRLGTSDFHRLRVGIGKPPENWKVPDYVLSRFSGDDKEIIKESVVRSAEAALVWASKGINEAMNKFNS